MADSPEKQPSKENLETAAKDAGGGEPAAVKEKPAKAGKDKAGKGDKGDKQTGSNRPSLGVGLAGAAKAATVRFMPTYRLESKNPLNKERVEIIVKAEMNKVYTDEYAFHPKYSLHTAAQVAEEIKGRIKSANYDRYRYIVIITVGEYLMQGLYSMANFLWDAEKDGFVNYIIETPNYFAVCTVYYLYYD
ncbi:CG14763 [Drosophila busckii]|uniref:CG14763 n=1 Tax=Drosophila busckii TaxID=30019 RepID=A0A0M4F1B2_DROBS|nr:tctex1 domain-containing protein 2 [Drosophila busckii]ALC44695.1 CG14763 [Drosophila busckii]